MSRLRLLVSMMLAALAFSAVVAASASAFAWWVSPTSKSSDEHELAVGEKLVFDAAATVKSPFTLKWFGAYEVRCAAASYNELFIESQVELGAGGIDFTSCTVKKPAGYTVVGGQIDTSALSGEIAPVGSTVAFTLAAEEGPLATFELENESKCTYGVAIEGTASGTLTAAKKLQKEKFLKFKSTALSVSQSKDCGTGLKEKKGKKPREEGEGKVEGNKGNIGYSSEPSFWSAH